MMIASELLIQWHYFVGRYFYAAKESAKDCALKRGRSFFSFVLLSFRGKMPPEETVYLRIAPREL